MATITSPAPIAFPDPKPLSSMPATHPIPSSSPSNQSQTLPQPNGHAHAHTHAHQPGSGGRGGDSLTSLGDMDAKCGGCMGVIEQDNGGIVVAFGNSLWHVDCFKCTKCKEKVSADTNLLLLSDGSPVCGNCSYQCFVCKQAITEEAIMTGDESYHAHCFTCRTCKKRIEELVFAKTSQGIYCMACHNERVAKSRRHAEAKRQRAARKEREREGKDEDRQRSDPSRSMSSSSLGPNFNIPPLQAPLNPLPPATTSPTGSPYATPISQDSARLVDHTSPMINGVTSSSEDDHSVAGGSMMSGSRSRELSVEKPMGVRAASPNGHAARRVDSGLPPLPQSPSEGSYNLSNRPRGMDAGRSSPGPVANTTTLNNTTSSPNLSPATTSLSTGASRSQSSQGIGLGLGVTPVGGPSLNVPTTKSDRRRSINPAMTFNLDAQNNTFAVEPRMSPLPPSPLRASFTDAQKAQAILPSSSPTSPSPMTQSLTAEFPFKASGSVISRSTTPESHNPPPRKSSLTDVNLNITQPRSRSHSATSSTPAPVQEEIMDAEEEITGPPTQASSSTPKLIAPNLPTMSFSLSDPDFALILNGINQSPVATPGEKQADPVVPAPTVDTTSNINTVPAPTSRNEIDLDDTPPASPTTTDIPVSRSPPASVSSHFRSTASRDTSPGKTRLSPNTFSAPILRTRQPSAESTQSIPGRLGPDSAFSEVVGMVADAKHGNREKVEVDVKVLSGVVAEIEELKDVISGLRNKYTGAKRTSQQYSEGLTVAGEEYDKEVALRRDLEAEITRLKAQVHSQTARLSVISGDERRQENMRRRSHDLANSLTGLERDISKLRAQRDMTIAEVEELQKRQSAGPEVGEASELSQSLTHRLDTIKEQYREELEPLTAQREALQREIADLRETRDQFLEESTALAAKNEELAELNTQLSRQVESMQEALARQRGPTIFNKRGHHPSNSPSLSSLATSATLQEVPEETARVVKVTKPDPQPIEAAPARRFKWYGYKSSKGPSVGGEPITSASISRPLALGLPGPSGLDRKLQRPSTEFGIREHSFQQHSSMRFARCDLCAEKMWGLQEVKCSSCGTVCHAKCAEKLPRMCAGAKMNGDHAMDGPLPPSMFGRDLAEQASADRSDVPVIVTKSISAVEAVGMEYEGIYRKTGGSSQSKQIQQLFERGDYDAFDLADVEAFNDISSVTSTLKTYFRQLPNPLLTHGLHESFVAAATIKDMSNRHTALVALLKELPKEHYNTLRALMLHLNRVTAASANNLMTSQNLGVVFGPTLMRSSDPNREFGDMGGKAMCIQWMVENAASAFAEER